MGDCAEPADPAGPRVPGRRERISRALLSRRGIRRTVNGIPLRVDPIGRHVFTSIYDAGAAAWLRTHLAMVWKPGTSAPASVSRCTRERGFVVA